MSVCFATETGSLTARIEGCVGGLLSADQGRLTTRKSNEHSVLLVE